ncbi:hypothetical protein ACLMAL_39455, partial [Nocardia sp. CWNU-33]|uniref:hypothetical protein n=1 Tax=Nocardia sp. CWNU-33 TaxID=3392117 RepID=UPI00398EF98D
LVMTNERLLDMFPGPRNNPWTPTEFEQKTGIRQRRFSVDLDDKTGRAVFPPGYGEPPGPAGILAENTLQEALTTAGIDARELDGLIIGCCTPDLLHFGTDAQLLGQIIEHPLLPATAGAVAVQASVTTITGSAVPNIEVARSVEPSAHGVSFVGSSGAAPPPITELLRVLTGSEGSGERKKA